MALECDRAALLFVQRKTNAHTHTQTPKKGMRSLVEHLNHNIVNSHMREKKKPPILISIRLMFNNHFQIQNKNAPFETGQPSTSSSSACSIVTAKLCINTFNGQSIDSKHQRWISNINSSQITCEYRTYYVTKSKHTSTPLNQNNNFIEWIKKKKTDLDLREKKTDWTTSKKKQTSQDGYCDK